MRTREIWFTYTTRDLPHKKGAILETKFLGVNSVTKLLLKQLEQKNVLCEICGHGIINSSSAVLADKIATSANVKASYEVFSGMTSAPVIKTVTAMVILLKRTVLILLTSNYLPRHILS